jgi:hypothetical protein
VLVEENGYKNSHHDSLQKAKSEIAFQNTMDSLRTNATRTKYAHSLDEYVKFLGLKNGDREDLSQHNFIICVLIYGNMYMNICRVLSCFPVFHLEGNNNTKILNE